MASSYFPETHSNELLFENPFVLPEIGENPLDIVTFSHGLNDGSVDHQRHQHLYQGMMNVNNTSVNHEEAIVLQQEVQALKRKVDVLTERKEQLENENASFKEEACRERFFKRAKRGVLSIARKAVKIRVNRKIKILRAEIAEQQKSIEQGQKEMRERFEEIDLKFDQLKKETKQASVNLHLRLRMMFDILKARQEENFAKAADLTLSLSELMTSQQHLLEESKQPEAVP